MNKKYLIPSLACCFLANLWISPVMAAESMQSNRTTQEQKRLEQVNKNLELKKVNALREIDRRVASLNNLIRIINNTKRLSESQKSQLVTQVNVEVTNLQYLRGKIEADSDIAMLTADKQSIVLSYRIYALFLPKINIIALGDQIIGLAETMTLKTQNQAALAKINDATTKAQAAIDSVMPLTPDGYPGNKATLKSANDQLRTARADLNAARPLLSNPPK